VASDVEQCTWVRASARACFATANFVGGLSGRLDRSRIAVGTFIPVRHSAARTFVARNLSLVTTVSNSTRRSVNDLSHSSERLLTAVMWKK
jgi:hypothetical protein